MDITTGIGSLGRSFSYGIIPKSNMKIFRFQVELEDLKKRKADLVNQDALRYLSIPQLYSFTAPSASRRSVINPI